MVPFGGGSNLVVADGGAGHHVWVGPFRAPPYSAHGGWWHAHRGAKARTRDGGGSPCALADGFDRAGVLSGSRAGPAR